MMKKVKLTGRIAKKSSFIKYSSLMLLCLLCMNRTGFAQVDLDNGLIAYLPLNGNGNDQSGNNNHAVNSPGTTQTFTGADRFMNFPGAMRFFGENGQSKMSFGTPLLSNRNAFTISFWFSIASGYSNAMNVFGQDNLLEVGYALSPNRLVIYHPVSATLNINLTSPFYNTWQHLLITGDATEMKIYLNGTLVSTQTGNYTLGANSNTTNIGGHVLSQAGTEWLKGHLDNLRIYSRVVTTDEINALFAENHPGIVIQSINTGTFCAGDDVSLSFTAAGNIQADNVYSLQLSQPDGSFTHPIVLSTLASSALTGSFNVEIPTGVYSGTNYKLRVVSSNMSAVSNETGTLTITSILGNLSSNSTYYFIGNVDGKNYYRSTGSSTASAGNTSAISNNGQLATVYNAAVNDLLHYNSLDTRVYIGLNDVSQEGTFVWKDGTIPVYTNWSSGQPDNSGNEDYVELRNESGLWNDITETGSKPHFMELLPAVNNQTVCIGQPINLQAKTITGASYSWTGPNGFSSTQQNPVISTSISTSAGVYSVTYSLNGCSVSDSATITLNTVVPNNIGQTSALLNSLNNGLVLHYPMNGNGNDASGNALNGTLMGGVIPRTDRFGAANAALQFNGTNGFMDVPDGVYFNGSDFTVTAWVRKVSNNNWSRLFDFGNGQQNNNVLVAISSLTSGRPAAQVYAGTVGGPTITSPTLALTNNQWNLLTYVYSNGSAELYIDGVLVTQGAQSTPNNVVRTVNYIARSNWTSDGYSNAGLDDFRLYNRKLTTPEIQSLLMEQPNALAATLLPGVLCNGTAQIALLNSQPGVAYQLINTNTSTPVGTAQAGTGDTLVFTTGVLTGATDFHFSAVANSGCGITLTQTLTAAPHILPTAPTALNDSICNEGILTIGVSGGTNYLWYTVPTGGIPLAGITGASYTTAFIDETENYYVSTVDNFGCESPRTQVSAVVINPLSTLVDVESGLILNYKFQNNFADSSGNGYHAAASGANTFVNDRDGNALSALNTTASGSGGSNFLSAGNPVKIQQLTNQVTISMWIRQTQTWFGSTGTDGFMPLINKWGGGTGMYLALRMQNPANMSNRVRWRINGGAIVEGNTNVPVGQWHHIVCVYDGSHLRIYQNGIQTGQTPMTGTIPNTSYNLMLGRQSDGFGEITYRGDWDEVKIYNRSLNANEIQTLFNNESVAFVNGPFCDGQGNLQLSTLNFPGATYQWSGPNGFSSTQQNPPVILNADSATYAGLYTLQVTANGCTSPIQEANAVIYEFPADPVAVNDTVCGSGNAVLTASGAGTGANYRWYTVPAGGTPISGQTGASLTINNVTATTVRYVSIIRNGCESGRTEVKAVYFNNLNTALTVNGSSVCANAPTADVTVLSSENGVNYQVFLGSSPVSPVVSGGGDILLPVNTAALSLGTNTITIKASYPSCGAVNLSNTATVTVLDLPVVSTTPGGTASICQGNSINLTASLGNAYLWNTGETSASIQVQTAGNYSVTVTDANGCSNTSAAVVVAVDQIPVPVITVLGSTTFCVGESVTLTASGGANFLWNTNETSTSITVNQPGTYHFTAFNGSCSAVSSDITVTVNPLPVVLANSTETAVCNGETIVLTGSGALNYSWNNGVTDGVSFTPAATTTYTVTGTDANNCSASASVIVTVNNLPNAAFTPEFPALCAGTAGMDLTAVVSSYPDYDWYENGNPLQLNGTSVQVITSSGTYGLTVTDAFGCTNSSTFSVVPGVMPSVSISAPAVSFCSGASETITASLVPGGIYTWYQDGIPVTMPTVEDVSFQVTQAGNYTVEVENTSGCSGTSNALSFTLIPLPVAVISSNETGMCAGDSILLTANQVSGASYQWFQDSNPVAGAISDTYFAATAGNYQVQLTDGCTGISNTISITINASPSNAGIISGSTSFCAGETAVFSTASVNNATSYNWIITPAGAASISQGQGTTSVTVNTANSNFTLQVTPQNACGVGSASSLNITPVTSGPCLGEVLFAANNTQVCAGSQVVFYNYTDPNIFAGLTPQWNFGAGASPATATGYGPHTVTYSTQGLKTVTLDYEDAFGNSFGNETKVNYVNVSGVVSTSAISGNTTVSCNTNSETYSVLLSAGSTYQWNVPAGAVILSGQGTNVIVVDFNGNFGSVSVVETNMGGCQGEVKSLSVSCNLGLEESETAWVQVYPNPANESFRVALPQTGSAHLQLFDAQGKLVKDQSVYSLEAVDIRELEPAVYIGKVVFGDRQTVLFRLVKQ